MPSETRQSLVPAVYLVLIQDGRLLMARRINTGYGDGMYSLVAGHVEAGERLVDALIREAREEVGVILAESDLTLAHTLHRPDEGRIDFFFTTQAWDGVIQIKEPEKCDDLSWFPLDSLPESTLPYIRHGVDQIVRGAGFSDWADWD